MNVLVMGVLLLAGLLVFFLLLGGLTPGDGRDLVDWDPVKRAEAAVVAEHEDFREMVELNNRHRRESGLPELGEHELWSSHAGSHPPSSDS